MCAKRLALPQEIHHPLHKGYINKQGGSHKNWKTRYAILYPHLLVYYVHSGKYEYDIKRGCLENRKNHVILHGAQVVCSRSSLDKLQFAFTIIVTATDNKRTTYVIANSSIIERDLWMDKVNEAINGGATPDTIKDTKVHPKLKLLTKESTLRLLDSNTADSVRNAMVDKDSESDIDDTDSENENEPHRRSAKSQALAIKAHSVAQPSVSAVTPDACLSTTASNMPRPMLQKEAMTMNPDVSNTNDESVISLDDSHLKHRHVTDQVSDDVIPSCPGVEIILTWSTHVPNTKVMLGKEGFLYKQGGKHKTWKYRYVIAVPGRLAYYKSKPHGPGDKAMGIVKLKNIACSSKPGIAKFPNLFEITSNSQWNKRGTYVFSAVSGDERTEWMEALQVLGGNYKAHIEELTELETHRDPIGPESRAKSFSDAITSSIDEDDYVPKKEPVLETVPEGAAPELNIVPCIEPLTTKTKRHVEGNYDLDISYITSNILVMSFPYSKEELYNTQKGRNDIDIVEKFLNEKYNKSYRVYNLCKEMTYPNTRFNGNIGLFPYEDHCPPPLLMLDIFIKDMQNWMGADSNNVAVIHCNSGKGRSGCMVASYLIYAKEMFYNEAITQFNTNRINFGRGLVIPSHLRYIKYVDRIRLNPTEYSFDRNDERTIESIQIKVPNDAGPDWKPFVTIVSMDSNLEMFNSVKEGVTAKNTVSKLITIRDINLVIKNNIQVNIWDFDDNLDSNLSLDAYLFIHSAFITDNVLLFKKCDLDKLYKSKVQGFSISIHFAPLAS
ncbi:hypothetical protein LOD99_5934 [Oopsacas minuta]|uniref:Phosphatidylinositol-3,4,5-trisphosphate 3-phosphatase n=1 Tax=Oopsacas minuta TaxID=111878 RepID=A0AAV7JPF5_9METZ|nr:hypothetical protein LOD99_5934 [Oopsacas minuta]